jgi:hypothetical protein
VGHFKTLYELAGPAAKLLPSLSPAQLATVVEALGAAGVNDAELLKVGAGSSNSLQEHHAACFCVDVDSAAC